MIVKYSSPIRHPILSSGLSDSDGLLAPEPTTGRDRLAYELLTDNSRFRAVLEPSSGNRESNPNLSDPNTPCSLNTFTRAGIGGFEPPVSCSPNTRDAASPYPEKCPPSMVWSRPKRTTTIPYLLPEVFSTTSSRDSFGGWRNEGESNSQGRSRLVCFRNRCGRRSACHSIKRCPEVATAEFLTSSVTILRIIAYSVLWLSN